MAERFGIPVLYIFSNQIEPVAGIEHVRRMSGNYSEGEQYANLLDQTERILKLVEQTESWWNRQRSRFGWSSSIAFISWVKCW